MISCFVSSSDNPHFNLCLEGYLFSKVMPEDLILYLWRNSETVVIGKYQNPWSECNVDKMNDEGIKLMRRYSGGGAVFQDLGNLCFTLISGSSFDVEKQKYNNNEFIISTLKKFSIDACASGRNDILVSDRKISGAAFQIKRGNLMHHGTLLVNTDLDKLQLYLNPSKEKLATKGIRSVRSRVANLQEFDPSLTVEKLIDALKNTYRDFFQEFDTVSYVDESILASNAELKSEYDKLVSWDWLYGKTPDFTDIYKKRFSWGDIELLFNVHGGIIENITVYSDTLDNNLVDEIKKILLNIIFDNKNIVDAIKNHTDKMDDCDTKSHLLDVITLFE